MAGKHVEMYTWLWVRAMASAAAALIAAGWTVPAGAEAPAAKPTQEEQRAARAAKEAAWVKAAESRTDFMVRGLRLGMTLPELETKLGSEVVEIRPERKPDWKPPTYSAYEETLRLSDGSRLRVAFSSPVTGSVGGMVMYEQTLLQG